MRTPFFPNCIVLNWIVCACVWVREREEGWEVRWLCYTSFTTLLCGTFLRGNSNPATGLKTLVQCMLINAMHIFSNISMFLEGRRFHKLIDRPTEKNTDEARPAYSRHFQIWNKQKHFWCNFTYTRLSPYNPRCNIVFNRRKWVKAFHLFLTKNANASLNNG